MRSPRILLVLPILSLVLFLAGEAMGQAWVLPRKGYYLKVWGSYLLTEEEYNFRGDRQPINAENLVLDNTSFQEVAFTAYLEYGITESFTLVAELPFKILTTKETLTPIFGATPQDITRTNANFSDLTLLLRAPLLRRPFALSVQGGAKIPTGYPNDPGQGLPAMGTGYVDGIVEFNLGVSLYPVPAYVSAGAGYVARGGPLHDEMVFNVQAGYTLKRLFLKLELQGVKNTIDPPDLAGMPIIQPGRVDRLQYGDQDVLKLIPIVAYSFSERFQITGEMYHVLGGKNTLAGTTYALGVIFQRKE